MRMSKGANKLADAFPTESAEDYKAKLLAKLQAKVEAHHALFLEYLEAGDTEMAHSSRTLSK